MLDKTDKYQKLWEIKTQKTPQFPEEFNFLVGDEGFEPPTLWV